MEYILQLGNVRLVSDVRERLAGREARTNPSTTRARVTTSGARANAAGYRRNLCGGGRRGRSLGWRRGALRFPFYAVADRFAQLLST